METVICRVGEGISRRFGLNEKTEVSVTLVNDETIQELNKSYRGIDRPTDVLSFAFDEATEGEAAVSMSEQEIHLLGEIVISLERTIAQAEEYGHSVEREMAFLFVHGMLHLLGYDHQEDEERRQMRQIEEEILEAVAYGREN
ncbi:MAG TPA: rRNA maturation RNase YbeY [Clostridia bacterium]|jgi:probable rRNA maturation factor|nr:rRNA maturation RNase YbeY [Clostridia bacterium]